VLFRNLRVASQCSSPPSSSTRWLDSLARAAVAGPGRQHQPLVGHLEELGSYLGVAKEALLKLQEGKV
jgi:hypothetical protein